VGSKDQPNQNLTQRERFIQAARELGADEDEATFKTKLAAIGKRKPKPLEGAEDHVPSADDDSDHGCTTGEASN
jgi:hypothetical protein